MGKILQQAHSQLVLENHNDLFEYFVVLNSWLFYSFVFLFIDTKTAISKVFTINYNKIASME